MSQHTTQRQTGHRTRMRAPRATDHAGRYRSPHAEQWVCHHCQWPDPDDRRCEHPRRGKQALSINDEVRGQTPLTTPVSRRRNHTVRIEKPGYQPVERTLTRHVNGWVFGNLLIGGILGTGIDAATGAIFEVEPDRIFATLAPQEQPPVAPQEQPPVAPQETATSSPTGTATSSPTGTATSSPTGTATSSPTEAAISSATETATQLPSTGGATVYGYHGTGAVSPVSVPHGDLIVDRCQDGSPGGSRSRLCEGLATRHGPTSASLASRSAVTSRVPTTRDRLSPQCSPLEPHHTPQVQILRMAPPARADVYR